jgi:hypothetical protein
MDKKSLEINQPVSAHRRESKNRKFLFKINFYFIFIKKFYFLKKHIFLNLNFLVLDSRWPTETGLVSFLDLPPCENVQKVQK